MSIEAAIAQHLVPVIGIIFGTGFMAIIILSDTYRKMRNTEQNAVLKRMMIEKGYTSEEILAVIQAVPGQNRKGRMQQSNAASTPVT